METIYFLDFDQPRHEYFVMKQREDGDAHLADGPFSDAGMAHRRAEQLAHKLEQRDGKTAVFTVMPDWAQAQDYDQFSARSCWKIN